LIPWWWFVLLSLATYRIYRLLAEDTILDRPRRWLLRLGPDWEEEGDEVPPNYRAEWAVFLTCPYCAGFWISGVALTLYSLIIDWNGVFAFLVIWFAISAVVAFLAKVDEKLNEDPPEPTINVDVKPPNVTVRPPNVQVTVRSGE
jgi:hypothetical protein